MLQCFIIRWMLESLIANFGCLKSHIIYIYTYKCVSAIDVCWLFSPRFSHFATRVSHRLLMNVFAPISFCQNYRLSECWRHRWWHAFQMGFAEQTRALHHTHTRTHGIRAWNSTKLLTAKDSICNVWYSENINILFFRWLSDWAYDSNNICGGWCP